MNPSPGTEAKFLTPNGAGPLSRSPAHADEHRGGFGVTYDQPHGDLRQANYSSLRAGKIEFRRMIEQDQGCCSSRNCASRWPTPSLSRRCWRARYRSARMATPASGGPPRFEMVDPNKEIGAAIASVRAGFSTVAGPGGRVRLRPTPAGGDRETNARLDDAGVILDLEPRRTCQQRRRARRLA